MENEYETLKKNKSHNEDTWREDGRWKTDPWKDWKAREATTKDDNNNWSNDDGRWEQKLGTNEKEDVERRVWRG